MSLQPSSASCSILKVDPNTKAAQAQVPPDYPGEQGRSAWLAESAGLIKSYLVPQDLWTSTFQFYMPPDASPVELAELLQHQHHQGDAGLFSEHNGFNRKRRVEHIQKAAIRAVNSENEPQ